MSFNLKDDCFRQKRIENALDGQLASTPDPIELCMASYQGLYAKFVSNISPKYSIVDNDGELMLHFLPQQQYFQVYALFLVIMPVSFTFKSDIS